MTVKMSVQIILALIKNTTTIIIFKISNIFGFNKITLNTDHINNDFFFNKISYYKLYNKIFARNITNI
jgi:hypothetical protein